MYLNAKKRLKEKEIIYNTWAVNKYSESLEEPFFMDWKYSAVRYEMKQFYTMKQKFVLNSTKIWAKNLSWNASESI